MQGDVKPCSFIHSDNRCDDLIVKAANSKFGDKSFYHSTASLELSSTHCPPSKPPSRLPSLAILMSVVFYNFCSFFA